MIKTADLAKPGSLARQGDVLIIRADHDTAKLKQMPRERGAVILALGDATGHPHLVRSEKAALFELGESRGGFVADRVLVLGEDAVLEHEEHHHIALPEGTYVIRRQREYTPGELRSVVD